MFKYCVVCKYEVYFEVAQNVYELIVDAGHEYGLMHAG